ncbi:unnamed protein product, partial [Amoebophrya sp. A25]
SPPTPSPTLGESCLPSTTSPEQDLSPRRSFRNKKRERKLDFGISSRNEDLALDWTVRTGRRSPNADTKRKKSGVMIHHHHAQHHASNDHDASGGLQDGSVGGQHISSKRVHGKTSFHHDQNYETQRLLSSSYQEGDHSTKLKMHKTSMFVNHVAATGSGSGTATMLEGS